MVYLSCSRSDESGFRSGLTYPGGGGWGGVSYLVGERVRLQEKLHIPVAAMTSPKNKMTYRKA